MEREATKQMMAGLFILLGIALLIFMVFWLSSRKGISHSSFQVEVLYRHVGGLLEGAPVRLAGVDVGNVADIEILRRPIAGRRVRVILNIYNKYSPHLEEAVRVQINSASILGEKMVEITLREDEMEDVLDLSQPVMGEDSFELHSLAAMFAAAAQSLKQTADELNEVDFRELSVVMGETAQSLLTTTEGVNSILEEFQDITFKSKRLIDRFEQKLIDGNLFKVF